MKRKITLLTLVTISTILYSQEMKPLKPKTIINITSPQNYIKYNQLELNKLMPEVTGTTLDKIKVDSLFFKDKVTVLNFSFIGCAPCMQEVKYLNQINEEYKNRDVNIISVYSINKQGLIDFLNAKEGVYKTLRQNAPFDTINYTLMPECLGETDDYRYSLGPKCSRLSKYYGVNGYPLTIIIGRDRIVRYVSYGFPKSASDAESKKNEWINLIDELLEEQITAGNP